MLLYQFKAGTNPRRVSIYLAEKGLDIPRYELDYANREHKSPAYLALNAAGRAPALVTDSGEVIADSAAIVEYLEELYPANSMIGNDAATRAKVRALERLGTDLVVRAQIWLWNETNNFPFMQARPSSEMAGIMFQHVTEILDALEKSIGDYEFLAGNRPTIADFTVFAIFQTARERFNLPFGNRHPRLDAWFANFRKRPSADY
ncbi:glutathione S-transferase family protein [Thalassospira marina]|uniref:Glutathione S-transferase n=1 Tax=Thalassospira marina TaxID=2048283 RepID=A0ABN5FP20_9PROT|nr:glutathione S-transferase N-terminal domain-containing protein [Thalassospira marina]AUG55574.1 glutathione S-transferase [Thalassospira marina]